MTKTATTPPRPTATSEMRLQVATAIVADLFDADCLRNSDADKAELAGELADAVQRSWSYNGYAIAKELDDHFGWSPNCEMIEHLDHFKHAMDQLIERATAAWIAENKIEPPFQLGDRVSARWGGDQITGTIDEENHPYKPGYCAVRIDNTVENSRALVRWEDCEAAQ